ncbi:MAG: NUDIX hydrolase [Phycisphaerales bacterium]
MLEHSKPERGKPEASKPRCGNGSPSLTRTTIHVGAKFDLEQVAFIGADGSAVVREVVRHPGAVVVLPLIEIDGAPGIVLIKNFRLSIGDSLWELPAGTREPGEDPLMCAARELQEETGYQAATIEPFGWYHLSPGMTDERMFAFVASNLRRVGQRTEVDEFISVHPMHVDDVLRMISSGEIVDAKTIATVLRWRHAQNHPCKG